MAAIEKDIVVPPLPLTERGFGLHLGGTLKKAVRIAYGNQALCIQREVKVKWLLSSYPYIFAYTTNTRDVY